MINIDAIVADAGICGCAEVRRQAEAMRKVLGKRAVGGGNARFEIKINVAA